LVTVDRRVSTVSSYNPRSPDRPPAGEDEAELVTIDLLQTCLKLLGRRLDPDREAVEAWDRFYRVYAPLLRRLAGEYVPPGDDADDRVQEVWCAVLARLPRFRVEPDRGRLRAWLTVLARHALVDRSRRQGRPMKHLSPAEEGEIPGRDSDPAAAYEQGLRQGAVRAALAELRARVPEPSFLVLHLRWFEGLSVAEISTLLGMEPAQVRLRHHRMVRRLRRLLPRHLDPESSDKGYPGTSENNSDRSKNS
jgi:RNA polymerase sigma factor (sigma-70 family)